MTDWAVQSVFFCLNTAQKPPKIERNRPNTALKLLANPPKKRSSKLRGRDCPNTAQRLPKATFYKK